MAVEARRRCGFRKVGGLYMVSGKLDAPCGRLPIELDVCPVCNGGIKQTRGWTWVKPEPLLGDPNARCGLSIKRCARCPAGDPAQMGKRCGLIWIGEQFYPTPDAFMVEAMFLGVSRRIGHVPREFVLGETWVLIAHPKAIVRKPRTEEETDEAIANDWLIEGDLVLVRKGIITIFKPTALEMIVTASQFADSDAMSELTQRGITPVVVPDDDKDHQGSAYDRDDEPTLPMKFKDGGDQHAST